MRPFSFEPTILKSHFYRLLPCLVHLQKGFRVTLKPCGRLDCLTGEMLVLHQMCAPAGVTDIFLLAHRLGEMGNIIIAGCVFLCPNKGYGLGQTAVMNKRRKFLGKLDIILISPGARGDAAISYLCPHLLSGLTRRFRRNRGIFQGNRILRHFISNRLEIFFCQSSHPLVNMHLALPLPTVAFPPICSPGTESLQKVSRIFS